MSTDAMDNDSKAALSQKSLSFQQQPPTLQQSSDPSLDRDDDDYSSSSIINNGAENDSSSPKKKKIQESSSGGGGVGGECPPGVAKTTLTTTATAREKGEKEASSSSLLDGAACSGAAAAAGDSPDDNDLPPLHLHNPSLYETISFWSECTSIHGMYYMFERGHLTAWKQLLWSCLCIAFAAGLLWSLQEEIREFKQYSTSYEYKTVIPQSLSMPFPQVTICNTNRWEASRQNATGIMEPQNEDQVNLISQPMEEFIMGTVFNGIQMFDDNANSNNNNNGSGLAAADVWTPVITPFGRCFTFITNETIFVPGPIMAGLDIYAWLNQTNYEEKTVIAGVIVFVTEKGSVVTSHTPSVFVPPGSASFVSVSKSQFQREERAPWRRCNGNAPEYSNELCRANCFRTVMRQECNCRLLGDETSNTTTTTSTSSSTSPTTTSPLRYCKSTDEPCQRSVLQHERDIYAYHVECQYCSIPPCREEVYVTSYSSARIAATAADNIEALQGLDPGVIAQNFVYVNVNYGAIRYEQRSESRSTDVAQLLSNLGGYMGFFMGISMISIVELFGELLMFRLLPRLWGDRRLYGVGQKED